MFDSWDPKGCSLPGSSVHCISQARILQQVAISFSRGSSQPRDWTQVSHIAGLFFTSGDTREAPKYWSDSLSLLQRIFLIQESNHGLLHCRWILYHWAIREAQPLLHIFTSVPFSWVHSLSHVRLFVTPWTTAHQASLSITNSRSPPKPMSIESVMPSNHLILCRPLTLPPKSFPPSRSFQISQFFAAGGQSIGVSASAPVLPMNIQDWFPLGCNG